MKAELFYYESQSSCAEAMVLHLRRLGYSVVKQCVVRETAQGVELARRFVKLLQAAIPPERGLQLSFVEHQYASDWFYFRMYFYVNGARRSLQGGVLDAFFPAVSIAERMVIVPKGLEAILSDERNGFPKFVFSDASVMAVEFKEGAVIEATISKVDEAVRSDLLRELIAYAGDQGLAGDSLLQVSRALDIAPTFLRRVLESGAGQRSAYRGLTCSITPTQLSCKRWSKAEFTIRNVSDQPFQGLRISIKGPVEVLPTRIEMDLDAKSEGKAQISLKADEPGDFPVEVTLTLAPDAVFAEWLPTHHVWLQAD